MPEELKPCSECNVVPLFVRDDYEQEWRVECECPHRGSYNSRENAIAAWNRRPGDAVIESYSNDWLIFFDEAGKSPEIYTDEDAARKRFADLSMNWTCHLFRRVKELEGRKRN